MFFEKIFICFVDFFAEKAVLVTAYAGIAFGVKNQSDFWRKYATARSTTSP